MDDIKNIFGKITRGITKTSGDIVKSTKLSINLANEEEKLRSLYFEIGKKVHEIYAYGGTLGKFFDEKYLEILEQENTIKELKGQIDTVKGSVTCPDCNGTVSANSTFCPNCGKKVSTMDSGYIAEKEIKVPDEFIEMKTSDESIDLRETVQKAEEIIVPVEEVKTICSSCKYENKTDDKFCFHCGRKL